jgi:hypothetical protein
MNTPAASPTRAVLAAVEAGTPTLADIARHTGLDRGVVAMAVDRLVQAGLLDAETMTAGCPPDGCGSCASGVADRPGCGAATPSSSRGGAVLVTLSVRRR